MRIRSVSYAYASQRPCTRSHLVLKHIVQGQSVFGAKSRQSSPDGEAGQSDVSCPAAEVDQVEWLQGGVRISEDQSWSKVGLGVVVQQPNVIYPHQVNRDSAHRIRRIAVYGMTTAFDSNLALIFNSDFEDSGNLGRVTWLHATGGLDFLCFGIPDGKVWVIGARMKGGGKLLAQLLTLVLERISIRSSFSHQGYLLVDLLYTYS